MARTGIIDEYGYLHDFDTYNRPGDLNTTGITCTPEEYAPVLNSSRDLALNRGNT